MVLLGRPSIQNEWTVKTLWEDGLLGQRGGGRKGENGKHGYSVHKITVFNLVTGRFFLADRDLFLPASPSSDFFQLLHHASSFLI